MMQFYYLDFFQVNHVDFVVNKKIVWEDQVNMQHYRQL